MGWIERLNKSIDYIEEHLTEEIDYESVAKVALCSSYHFQRMFSYMAEMTISEYIRRRRMSRAAVDLLRGENDAMCEYDYVKKFADEFGCEITEQNGGEHWFHTDTQLKFFREWLDTRLS